MTSLRPGPQPGPTGTRPSPPPPAWPERALATLGLGLLGYGITPALKLTHLAGPALAAGVCGALALTVHGLRTRARRHKTVALRLALAPVLGLKPSDMKGLRIGRWRHGWIGIPTRLTLPYAPSINETAPDWLPAILDALTRRLDTAFQVRTHDRRTCRLVLREVDAVAVPQLEAPKTQLRAELTVRELLGPAAQIRPTWQGSELAALDVTHEGGIRVSSPQFRARAERVVSTMLPGRWRGQWDLENATVRFELRPTLPRSVPHPVPGLKPEERLRIPLGADEDGQSANWDMRTSPHLMVVGKTGAGKTVVINGVVMEMTARGWPVRIVDPKRIEFLGLRDWPNVQVVATSIRDQVVTIYDTWQEMEDRYALIEAGAAVEEDFEPLILVLDEYRDFHGAIREWYASIKLPGMPSACPVFEKVSSLARKGRSAQVHLVLGTQRPDSEFLSGEMRDNFSARISLGRLSPQGAMMMWEAPYIGVSVPKAIAGRGTSITADDRPVEVQAYWTPDPRRAVRQGNESDLALLKRLRPSAVRHLPLQVQVSEELLRERDKNGRTQEWRAVMLAELVPSLEQPHPLPGGVPFTKQPTAAAAVALADSDEPLERDDQDVGGPLDYGEPEEAPVGELQPGDLILIDDSLQTWAVVENVEVDLTDATCICVDWRLDDDGSGALSLSDGETIAMRRPLDGLSS